MGRKAGLAGVMLAMCSLASCGDDGRGSAAKAATDCPPITVEQSPGKATRTPPEPDDLATAVAQGFCSIWVSTYAENDMTFEPVVDAGDAQCIAEELINAFGEQRVRELGFGGPWNLLFFALGNRTIERADSEQIVEAFVECSDQWELLLIQSVTEGAWDISDESAECVRSRLDDDEAREILAGEIDRAYDDPRQQDATPYPELVTPLVAAMDACLTAAELDGMDWN